jgi:hypothetical protein
MNTAGESSDFATRAEIFRIARFCAPPLDTLGQVTFTGDPAIAKHLLQWRDAILVPHIAPAARSAYRAAKHGFRELSAADKKLDLAGPLAKNSRAAGRLIARSSRAPVGETALERYLAAVDREECPGHMTVVFAARAAVFHLPEPLVLAAIVFVELRSSTIPDLWTCVETCIQAIPPAQSGLCAA